MTRPVPAMPTASALKGVWFVFSHANHQVALWVSGLSGKEELYLDGSLIKERRKIALSSVHDLQVDGRLLRVELTTVQLKKGIFKCLLFDNGALVSGLLTEYIAQRRWQQSAFTICASAAVVYGTFKADASLLVAACGVVGVGLASHLLLGRQSGYVIRQFEHSTREPDSEAAR